MVMTPEELAVSCLLPVRKWYMGHHQMRQGLRKRPGWYGWRSASGGYCAAPDKPARIPCEQFTHGTFIIVQ